MSNEEEFIVTITYNKRVIRDLTVLSTEDEIEEEVQNLINIDTVLSSRRNFLTIDIKRKEESQ